MTSKSVVVLCLVVLGLFYIYSDDNTRMSSDVFYQKVMASPPYKPLNTQANLLQGLSKPNLQEIDAFQSGESINYRSPDWINNIKASWSELTVSDVGNKVVVIETKQSVSDPDTLVYRYRANEQTHLQLFEPWSASKVMAVTGAMLVAQEQGINDDFKIGDAWFSDLVTSIHSYAPQGRADGNSNAIATYFINSIGRKRLTELFKQKWLNVGNSHINGAYGGTAFQPESNQWQQTGKPPMKVEVFNPSSGDPNYLSYRCEHCAQTGNKPMSTLALAEWLKRLVVNQAEPSTQLESINNFNLNLLFYGKQNNDNVTGMTAGISRILANAIVQSLLPEFVFDPNGEQAKQYLDKLTDGKWRIFQKIGWGYSGTRTAGEMIYLAHVSLPNINGGHEFTIAAQTSVSNKVDNDEEQNKVIEAGMKMQTLMNEIMLQVVGSKTER